MCFHKKKMWIKHTMSKGCSEYVDKYRLLTQKTVEINRLLTHYKQAISTLFFKVFITSLVLESLITISSIAAHE